MKKIYTILFLLGLVISCGKESLLEPTNNMVATEATEIIYITNVIVTNTFVTNYVYTTNFVYTNSIVTNHVYTTNYVYYTNSFNSSFKVYAGTNSSDFFIVELPGKVHFSNEMWDLGNEYSDGTFTASQAGTYLFTGILKARAQEWDLEVRKNGTTIYHDSIKTYASSDRTPLEFTVIDIASAGDKYEVWAYKPGIGGTGIEVYSSFSGIRLN